jgi:hypothetical protein
LISIDIDPLVLKEIASLAEEVLLEMQCDTQYFSPDDQEDVLESVNRMMTGVVAMFAAIKEDV